jgi:integrase
MATIKFLLQSKSNPANIYVRLSIDRNNVFKRKSGYVINPKDWSTDTNFPKPNDEDLKKLKTDLKTLGNEIEKKLNKAITVGTEISGNWLQEQIDNIQGKQKKTDVDRLISYIQVYIDNLPFKEFPNGKRGVARGTIQKYTTLKNKIQDYEKLNKKKFYVKDVDLKFRNDLLKYFTEVDKLNSNSAGRYIRFLKTVCLDAHLNGYEVNKQLKQIKGFTEKASKIFLTFDELEKIEKKTFDRSALNNAKDWLIIGCYIGQRVSDLLTLTKENIKFRNGLELIELTQVKTGKRVSIPLHPKVKELLKKNNGNFPTKLSAQKFNKHLKDLCRIAGITQPTEGAKLDKETGRKLPGVYPKHELITSHVCRRSFASNFYGDIPTALLISITSHSSEKQFLEYIGKTQNDYAIQIAEYWNKQQLQAKKEPHLTVLNKAN